MHRIKSKLTLHDRLVTRLSLEFSEVAQTNLSNSWSRKKLKSLFTWFDLHQQEFVDCGFIVKDRWRRNKHKSFIKCFSWLSCVMIFISRTVILHCTVTRKCQFPWVSYQHSFPEFNSKCCSCLRGFCSKNLNQLRSSLLNGRRKQVLLSFLLTLLKGH